ncbi:hypothetical protein BK816_00370 [Boudabousia tangfeifanii]|uniref:Uncharacterized protein n=1 Tax=Boudabousia tangfeifanii TaxID=1912795 RepID=A0A1D9MI99_9ACTO|nr:hypothetical protein [Boudabousia tangfeifanii]AOZ71933.1 hypothetical protein BK816_00370 [Boudabousia tangfeifanii]
MVDEATKVLNAKIAELLANAGVGEIDYDKLGKYIYAYYDPRDWRECIRHNASESELLKTESLSIPIPIYIGKGVRKRVLRHISESLSQEAGMETGKQRKLLDLFKDPGYPDIRFLAARLEGTEDPDTTARVVETSFISMFGKESNGKTEREDFDQRMGLPRLLSNIAGSSTAVISGSLNYMYSEFRKEAPLVDLRDLAERLVEEYELDDWIPITITGSMSPHANVEQLKEITCCWWPEHSFRSLIGKRFLVLGHSASDFTNIQLDDGTETSAVVVRSAFIVDSDWWDEVEYYICDSDRISFYHSATFNPGLWKDAVGSRVSHWTKQLQRQSKISTEPRGVKMLETR